MNSDFPPPKTYDGSINVLITAFDAFGKHPENPSWLIARSLPKTIPGKLKKGTKSKTPQIRLHVLPSPLKVTYKTIRETIPGILFPDEDDVPEPNFDVVLHMGVSDAPAGSYYELETCAVREGYFLAGVDGKTKAEGFSVWKDEGAPEVLTSGFSNELVLSDWKESVGPGTDVRTSSDAGKFVCEYVLFTSLWEYRRRLDSQGQQEVKFPVTFLHVHVGREEKDITKGRDVVIALIKALVEHRPR